MLIRPLLVLICINSIYCAKRKKSLPKLTDLVDNLQQFQLKDILSSLFDITTLGNFQDESTLTLVDDEVKDKKRSISALNRAKKELLFQGDIQISRDHLVNIVREHLARNRRKRTAFKNKYYPSTIWKPYVAYEFHKSLTWRAKKSMLAAMSFWKLNSCVEFKKRNKEKYYLIMSGNEQGCWSHVGRDTNQRGQILNIGKGCEAFGITSHELAHALGLFHEQSRYDRDKYIDVVKHRIARENFFDFAVIGPNNMETYDMAYDIGSVMHYKPNEFTQSGEPTIIAKDTNLQATMGQFRGPSFLDVAKINKHYSCEKKCRKKIVCKNGGFQNSRRCSQCICPDGYGGKYCDKIQESNPSDCNGYLEAEETQRLLKINMKPVKKSSRIRKCVYHITAPEGKRIFLIVEAVIGNCLQGCYEESLELKTYRDKTVTGARFCCKLKKPRILLSESNTVPVITVAGKGQAFAQIRYSYVDVPSNRSPSEAEDKEKIVPYEYHRHLINETTDSKMIVEQNKIAYDAKEGEFDEIVRHEYVSKNVII